MSLPDHVDVRTPHDLAAGVPVVHCWFAHSSLDGLPAPLRSASDRLLDALHREELRGDLYELTQLSDDAGRPIVIVGLGDRQELTGYRVERAIAAASRLLTGRGYQDLAVVDPEELGPDQSGRAIVEGAMRGAYDSGLFKSENGRRRSLESLVVLTERDVSEVQKGTRSGLAIGAAIKRARDLVNTPANELTPSALADIAQSWSREFGLRGQVIDEKGLERLGMGSFLGVARGSDEPPRLISLACGDAAAPARLALVGKGITFDSGGLSLKTAEGMETMKGDMGGAAAVLAAMTCISSLLPDRIAVTAYAGATENMPGGHAMRPGDVLRACNGKTIEVLNTDAEGRLVLADVLAHAEREGATHVVDLATLTGSAMIALGDTVTHVTGRPQEWVDEVVLAARDGLEQAWAMPQLPEYRRAMDSEIADIKNSGPRYGGALNASAFLSEFVDRVPWAHLDIAGTAWNREPNACMPSGGTGAGVGAIVSLVRRLAGT